MFSKLAFKMFYNDCLSGVKSASLPIPRVNPSQWLCLTRLCPTKKMFYSTVQWQEPWFMENHESKPALAWSSRVSWTCMYRSSISISRNPKIWKNRIIFYRPRVHLNCFDSDHRLSAPNLKLREGLLKKGKLGFSGGLLSEPGRGAREVSYSEQASFLINL